MVRMPMNSRPKPMTTAPICRVYRFLIMVRIKPIKRMKGAKSWMLKAMIWAVMQVPMLAPSMV